MLSGFKTYAVAAIAILSAIIAYFTQQMTGLQSLEAIGLAVGLGGNRWVIRAGELLNGSYPSLAADPSVRLWVTYAGVALSILTSVMAGVNSQQAPAVTIGTILGALGLNFLGLGAKKAATA